MTLTGERLTCLRGDRLVFRDLDFRAAPGRALVLTGPNGAGKSTLLRLAATLLEPRSGQLVWQGRPVADDPDRYRAAIGYLGHLDAVKPTLTVAENLGFWARGDQSTIDRALEAFALTDKAALPARFLSAGQKRRLALARLTVKGAPIWLLDEPTTALDRRSTALFAQAVSTHLAEGGLALIATHVDLGLDAVDRLELAA
jgi:heme exporter protein A